MSDPAMSISTNAGSQNLSSPVLNSDSTPPTYATARAPKIASYEVFEATISDLKKTRQRVPHETAGHFIGPMAVEEFFNDFMPWNEGVDAAYKKVVPPQSRVDRLKSLAQCSEADSYARFVDSFQGWRGLGAPRGMPRGSTSPLKFEDSHKNCDRDCASYSADVSIYSGLPFVAREQEQVMDFANLHCWVEIKPSAEYDAFNDENLGKKARTEVSAEENGAREEEQVASLESEKENGGVDEDEESPDMSNLDRATDNPERPRNFVAETDKTVEAVVEEPPDSCYAFEKATKKGHDTRAQLASYARATMATQYRNYLFRAYSVRPPLKAYASASASVAIKAELPGLATSARQPRAPDG